MADPGCPNLDENFAWTRSGDRALLDRKRHAELAHDCGLHGNPSHTGVDDLEREYPPDLMQRMILYHYASEADGQRLRERGHRVARPGERLVLAEPTAERRQPA